MRGSVEEKDVEIVLEETREKFEEARPSVISDRGSQFIAKEFKEYIMEVGYKHILISVGYPQANGKVERFFKTIKEECTEVNSFLTLKEAKKRIGEYIDYYNNKRLHSNIGYIIPQDMLKGRRNQIRKVREKKLEAARYKRIEVYKTIKEEEKSEYFDAFPSN